jgi:hypothetical protein
LSKACGKWILILALLAACAIAFFLLRQTPAPVETASGPTEDALEELRSLPYVQWRDAGANISKKGTTLHEKDRVFEGYNFTTNYVNEVYLMDMEGRRVHTWRYPGKNLLDYAEFLEDGSVLVSAVTFLVKLSWDSKVLWKSDVTSHHDIDRLPGDEIITLTRDYRKYKNSTINFDGVTRLAGDGRELFTWKPFDHLDKLRRLHPESPLEKDPTFRIGGYDYYHMNTVKVLPETPLSDDRRFQPGNLLVCFRNVNLIAILDKDTWEIVWSWGPGELDWPHAPIMLENGRILIFDNGFHRGFTRLVEVDPPSGKIVWEYKSKPPKEFFTDYRGLAQRLPNGNTLVCECARGRAFEISSGGARQWEYWNPEIRRGKRQGFSFFKRLRKEAVQPFLDHAAAN